MENKVDTSVIIPCHNVGKTLDLQLECLQHQEDAEPFEIVIVDNKSTDNTRAIAESWKNSLPIKIVEANEHGGVSFARNRGVREASGDKLIFIDGDDAVPANYVSFCQRSLDEVPVYVAGFDPISDDEFIHGRQHVLKLIEQKLLDYRSPLPMEADPAWPVLPGGSFGIRKYLYLEVGGFDLVFEPGAEDNELAIRLLKLGYNLPVQRSTTIAYRTFGPEKRNIRAYFLRAVSAAKLSTLEDRWSYLYKVGGHPFISWVRTVAAALKVLKNRDLKNSWLSRFANSSGMLAGYIVYKIFRKRIIRKPGVGI